MSIFKFRKRNPDKLRVKLIVPGKEGYIKTSTMNTKELEELKADTSIPDGSFLIVGNA